MTPVTPARAPRTPLIALLMVFGTATLGCKSDAQARPETSDLLARQYHEEAVAAEVQRAQRMGKGPGQLKVQEVPSMAVGAGGPVSKGAGKTPQSLGRKLEKAIRDLYLAELELKLAEKKVQHAELKSADDAEAAKLELKVARQALTLYRGSESPELVAKETLKVDRLIFRHSEAEQNLNQMREEYARYETDGIAKRTGEIVVWRAETRLGFANRDLDLGKAALVVVKRTTIPLKIESLDAVVKSKEDGVRRATEAKQRMTFENKMSLTKARNSVAYKTTDLVELRASADKTDK
jgi:hypothetical protein